MKTYIITYLLLLPFLIPNSKTLDSSKNKIHYSSNDSITIKGKVFIKNTKEAPLSLTTINIKNVWNWIDNDLNKGLLGENKRVYVNKKGNYSIKIKKGDTLVLLANTKLYKRDRAHIIENIQDNQTINFVLTPNDLALEETKQNSVVYNNLLNHIKTVNPEKLVTVKGQILNKETQKPIRAIPISQPWVYNTNNAITFHLTDSLGKFSITVPKGDLISINSLAQESKRLVFSPQNDTIINLQL